MRWTFVIAILALTPTCIVLGQEQGTSRDHRISVEQAIKQLDNERIRAQIGADAVALDRIYADDFIGVGPSGTVRTKAQVISDFTQSTGLGYFGAWVIQMIAFGYHLLDHSSDC